MDNSTENIRAKILYVEDDPIASQLAELFLKGLYDLDITSDPLKAVEMTKQKKYSVILMDINLGRGQLNGLETTHLIKQQDNYADIPIIAITAFAMKGDKEEFLRAGCSYYLSKPYSKGDLFKTIELALSEKESPKIKNIS